jgi:hypothetical protein
VVTIDASVGETFTPERLPSDAGAVELHVVPRPADGELLAAGAELADQLGQDAVVGERPASECRKATESSAALLHSTQKSWAAGSRKQKRAVFTGPRWAKSGESKPGV